DLGIGDEVLVPERVVRRPALRADDDVVAAVLSVDQRLPPRLPRAAAERRQQQRRHSVPLVPFLAVRLDVTLPVLPHPVQRTLQRFVPVRHVPSASVDGRRPPTCPATPPPSVRRLRPEHVTSRARRLRAGDAWSRPTLAYDRPVRRPQRAGP